MLKSKRFRLKSHYQFACRELSSIPWWWLLVENVWISTFYQTFSLFNHILYKKIFAVFSSPGELKFLTILNLRVPKTLFQTQKEKRIYYLLKWVVLKIGGRGRWWPSVSRSGIWITEVFITICTAYGTRRTKFLLSDILLLHTRHLNHKMWLQSYDTATLARKLAIQEAKKLIW